MSKKASFSDAAMAFRRCIEFAYGIRRKNEGKDIPYTGAPLTEDHLLSSAHGIQEQLKSECLEYSLVHQGRDALDEILGCAIRLGMEKGIAAVRERPYMFDLREMADSELGREPT